MKNRLLIVVICLSIFSFNAADKKEQEEFLSCYQKCEQTYQKNEKDCGLTSYYRCNKDNIKDWLNCNARCGNKKVPFPIRELIKSVTDRTNPKQNEV